MLQYLLQIALERVLGCPNTEPYQVFGALGEILLDYSKGFP